jgi:hypothetical protein
MQYSFTNGTTYENMFIFVERKRLLDDRSFTYFVGILKHGTCKDVWML